MSVPGFGLSVVLPRPGRVLSPNWRGHWGAKQRAVRAARRQARLLMLRELARLRETGEPGPASVSAPEELRRDKSPWRPSSEAPEGRRGWLPPGWLPSAYEVTWFFWGGAGPDADNALACCKAYLDGCADALGLNDRVLDCAGILRVKDRGLEGKVSIRFF